MSAMLFGWLLMLHVVVGGGGADDIRRVHPGSKRDVAPSEPFPDSPAGAATKRHVVIWPADGRSADPESYFGKCGSSSVCDQRTHYCDPVIDECVRCDDDCSPARIRGHPSAIRLCRRRCALWYRQQKKAQQTDKRTVSDTAHEQTSEFDVQRTLMIVATCAQLTIAVSLSILVVMLVVCACKRKDSHAGGNSNSKPWRVVDRRALAMPASLSPVSPFTGEKGKLTSVVSASDGSYLQLVSSKRALDQ